MFEFLKKKPKVPDATLFPDLTWHKGWDSDVNFTPDLWKLQTRPKHLLFVYNEMQTNQRKHGMIGMERLGAAITEADNYVMWKKKLGRETFPFALEINSEQKFGNSSFLGKPAKIVGELYEVAPSMIKSIDSYLLNGVTFDRKRVALQVPFRYRDDPPSTQRVQRIKAWMYVGPDEFWLDQLDTGAVYTQVKLYSANSYSETLDKYYFFNEKLESNST